MITIPRIALAETGSTNAEAMRRGIDGAEAPLWVTAARQTAGRGRNGRAWTSEPGNLYASLLLRPACPPTALHQLAFVAGVAVVEAVGRAIGPNALSLTLKWPNDVLLGGAKLAGILAESTFQPGHGAIAVVGIGINVAHAPAGLGRAATSLAEQGCAVAPDAMLDHLSAALLATLAMWSDGGGFAAVRARWLAAAPPAGTPITVNAGSGPQSGTFAGLDADGALILRDHSGYEQRMTYGDVTLDTTRGGQGQR